MSTLCGILHLDGRPVDRSELVSMAEAAADRTPDGRRYWVDGSIGLAFGLLSTTPESQREVQPLRDERRRRCLCFAGRLDNRRELAGDLGLSPQPPGHEWTDGELVLMAFDRWQEACLDRILGDFCLALWDASRRILVCARDPVGTRPFYYHHSASAFYFASELRQLLVLPQVPRRPNEGMLGEYLVSRMVSQVDTAFEAILRLPPGRLLTVGDGGVEQGVFWDPSAVPSVLYQRDSDYSEHLLDLLRRAVSARLRADRKVGIQLSGGIDSSSVVAVAAGLAGSRADAAPELETYSLVFPGWDCDESDYIAAVVARAGLPNVQLPPELPLPARSGQQVCRYLDYPDYPNGTMSDPLERAVRDRDIRVVLTGLGGDEWFQRPDLHLADLLRWGRWLAAAHWLRGLPSRSWSPLRQHPLIAFGISPLLPDSIKTRWRRRRQAAVVAPWLGSSFAHRTNLADRLRQPLEWRGYGSLGRAGSLQAATQGFQTHALEMEERSAGSFHLELRYPFHDRRLIEFGLGLPADQRWRHGWHKFVLRQAMKGLLPEEVRVRRTKAEFSRVFVEALLTLRRTRFENLLVAAEGWVDAAEVLSMYDRMQHRFRVEGQCRGAEIWPLWSVHGADLWLRAHSGEDVRSVAVG